MLKYENRGNCIEINIPKSGYSIMAIYKSNDVDKIDLSLYLKELSIEDLRLIDTQEITSCWEKSKSNICAVIDGMLKTGFIQEYIKKYEYELKCFDYGVENLK